MNYYGLVGEKLGHSLSPKIHEYIFKKFNINGSYKLFQIPREDIKDLGKWMKLLDIKGVNVTIPYKKEVFSFLDYISKEGEEIGAINTILNKDGKLMGYNTDYYGFKYMLLDKEINVAKKRVVVLGTGGASKAVIQYLLDSRADEIFLVSRKKEDKNLENKKIKIIDYNDLKDVKGYAIINTTPVGMYPNIGETPVLEEIIKNFDCVVDLIYNPIKTLFIKIGEENKKKVCGGLMMLVAQGLKADELWEDVTIEEKEYNRVYNILEKELK
ncbi:MAG: shikimate dehydrogenase [Clostridium sp.]|uniref:shikimate dehydrogenase n=1 Tax=Clostridium sp. TaxID=1506 RepID=UPI003EE54B1C